MDVSIIVGLVVDTTLAVRVVSIHLDMQSQRRCTGMDYMYMHIYYYIVTGANYIFIYYRN